jgi:hypothetical protein
MAWLVWVSFHQLHQMLLLIAVVFITVDLSLGILAARHLQTGD